MRRLPAPVLPPPPPKPPNAPPKPSDSPKLGDDKLPTGVPRFTWFKRFWKLIETFRLYLFSLGAAAPPPCGPGPAPTAATFMAAPPPPAIEGPPGPPAGLLSAAAPLPLAAVCPPGFAAAALARWITPKANTRLMRMLT